MEAYKADPNKKKSWREVNKTRKEEKRKWREINLEKKMKKQQLKAESKQDDDATASLTPKCLSTLSIAVPGSILENSQTPELRCYLAGQIARAACIFQADEIVVFDDHSDEAFAKKAKFDDEEGEKQSRYSCVQLNRILQYLECPQYLRKFFFPIQNDLKYCGVLNPLNAPHHLSVKDNFIFREGVVLNTPIKDGKGSIVNVGLLRQVRVDKPLVPGLRCTVKLLPQEPNVKKLKGILVSPNLPRSETGIYWGYSVRIANSLSDVFSQCPYKAGYDLTIGTSDRGSPVDEFVCPKYKHLLVVFGGVQGLEAALENDSVLDADDPKQLFHNYLNTIPEQGSRTIRTEEAIVISLAALRPKLNPEFRSKRFDGDNVEFQEDTVLSSKVSLTKVEDGSKTDNAGTAADDMSSIEYGQHINLDAQECCCSCLNWRVSQLFPFVISKLPIHNNSRHEVAFFNQLRVFEELCFHVERKAVNLQHVLSTEAVDCKITASMRNNVMKYFVLHCGLAETLDSTPTVEHAAVYPPPNIFLFYYVMSKTN